MLLNGGEWNGVRILRPDPLFAGIRAGEFFYYANSFYPPSGSGVLAVSEYGQEFAAALAAANVRGVQFHPEKSGKAGLRLLANWAASC